MQSFDSDKSLSSSVTSSLCFCLFLLFLWASIICSLSHIHVYCSHAVRRTQRLFRVSLWYPAVNPLPSETLPFPFPDILTTYAHTMEHKTCTKDHTHTQSCTLTLQTGATYSNFLHIWAWICVCVGGWVYLGLFHIEHILELKWPYIS